MKTTGIVLAALTCALVLAAQAQTNVYRWTDKDGKVHFSDTPPPEDAKDASQKRLGGGSVEDPPLPYATQVAARRNPVTLYISTDCGDPCARARELLSQRGIPFSEKDAQANPADQETLKKLTGALQVPVLVVGESKSQGYEEIQWQSSLDTAGYPRTRPPGQPPSRPPPAPPKAPEPTGAEPTASPPAENK
jgi:glutaredoxin